MPAEVVIRAILIQRIGHPVLPVNQKLELMNPRTKSDRGSPDTITVRIVKMILLTIPSIEAADQGHALSASRAKAE